MIDRHGEARHLGLLLGDRSRQVHPVDPRGAQVALFLPQSIDRHRYKPCNATPRQHLEGERMTTDTADSITNQVRERYANAARAVQASSGCCDSGCCGSLEDDAVTRDLYDSQQTELLPADAVLA